MRSIVLDATLHRLSLVVVALSLAGCAVGPDYQKPVVPMDPAFVGARNTEAVVDIRTFWQGFGDEKLNSLIDKALLANGDVKLASARVPEVRASQDEANAAFRPRFGAQTDGNREVTPITSLPGTSVSDRTSNVYDANFFAAWEIDLFGRLRRNSEAATARAEAGLATLEAARTSVAGEVARNYLELRGLQQRLEFTQSSLTFQRDTLKLTEVRFDNGRGNQLDVSRAQGLVASTEANVPALQTAIERTIFRLATLTAQQPRLLLAELSAAAPLPALPVTDLSALPAGTTEQWLQRRPDIMAAEQQIVAANAGIGIATSELFPKLSVAGLLGLNSANVSDLSSADSRLFSLGVTLAWTPFDLGAVRARIRGNEARTLQSVVVYENTITAALEETEGAFSSFTRNAERTQKLDLAARSASKTAQLARLRYETGVIDFLSVLDAERQLLAQQDQLIQAQVLTATALVAVYRSLGGGWAGPQLIPPVTGKN